MIPISNPLKFNIRILVIMFVTISDNVCDHLPEYVQFDLHYAGTYKHCNPSLTISRLSGNVPAPHNCKLSLDSHNNSAMKLLKIMHDLMKIYERFFILLNYAIRR